MPMMFHCDTKNNNHNFLLNSILILITLSNQAKGQSSQADNTPNTTSLAILNPAAIGDDGIGVWIDVTPINTQLGINYVAANKPLQIHSHVKTGLNESLLEYKWSTKEGIVQAGRGVKEIVHKYTKANEDNFIQLDVNDSKTNSSGKAKLDVTVKEELVVGDPVGKTFVEKGELVKLNLVYSGSPPFKYCYKFCSDYDLLPCGLCFPKYETSNTTIPIVQYLHYIGNYTLMFQIENIMNYEERRFAIKIIGTVKPKSNLPIEPIVSSILAVCILITGVALHMRFKDTSYTTETANFDFFHDDNDEEWEQELSLIQRVRYLFCGSNQDEESETRYLIQNGATKTSLQSYSDGQHLQPHLESSSTRDEL